MVGVGEQLIKLDQQINIQAVLRRGPPIRQAQVAD
jgi:hypothetical protein